MLTSHELLGFMSPGLAQEILTFAYEADKPLYRATLGAVAEARKLRPVFLERQPRACGQRSANHTKNLGRGVCHDIERGGARPAAGRTAIATMRPAWQTGHSRRDLPVSFS